MARKRSPEMAETSEPKAPRRRTVMAAMHPALPGPNGMHGEDEIRNLAYQKWQEAGCPDGDGVYFWLAAESELHQR